MKQTNKDELELELQKGLDPTHVEKKQGYSYVAHAHMVSNLNRLFGFDGWDIYQEPIEVVHKSEEEKNGRTKYTIVCTVRLRLTVRGRINGEWRETVKEEVGTCGNTGFNIIDVWNTAYCGAPTYALKRAAHWMGNQFGASLYDRNNPVHEGGQDKWGVLPDLPEGVIEQVNEDFTTELKKARSKNSLEKVMVKFLPQLKTLPEDAKANLRAAYKDKMTKIKANGKGEQNNASK
jgi:hypothetical protein